MELLLGGPMFLAAGIYNFFYAIFHPLLWLNWAEKSSLANFIYFGGSRELFAVAVDIFLIVLVIGLVRRNFLWAVVRLTEGFSNVVGRIASWAVLFMVLQQIMVIFLQAIFRVSQISLGPFGMVFTRDLAWFGDELKFYNAIIVALCCSYTFVQGGHVRVDLFYAGARYKTKKLIDMLGSLFFMIPVATLIWMYGWFFLWRHLVTPKVSATDTLVSIGRKSKILKWNVETTGFSPSGFDGYFLFKILLVMFAAMIFIQGISFFYRSLLEYLEGEESEGKHLDKDQLGDDLAEMVSEIH
ncbi:MAG: C4-dicarboxylate ABC transporter permease [Rhodobacteraceae bacterium]|nr:C4-dicarboxylate ABC transporter permease [Paracoccaceae bacterium]